VPNFLRHHHPVGLGNWGHTIRQPALAPLHERRHFCEVIRELGDRIGITDVMNLMHNVYFGIEGEHALEPGKQYTWEQVADRVYKSYFGSERGLDWFREHGVVTWPKRVEEVFWKPFVHARAPLYNEWVLRAGAEIRRIAGERGMKGVHTHEFLPLPDWFPCRAAQAVDGFDLRAIYYRVPWHSFSATYENPWLDEISQEAVQLLHPDQLGDGARKASATARRSSWSRPTAGSCAGARASPRACIPRCSPSRTTAGTGRAACRSRGARASSSTSCCRWTSRTRISSRSRWTAMRACACAAPRRPPCGSEW
jgi:hypothetical protein